MQKKSLLPLRMAIALCLAAFWSGVASLVYPDLTPWVFGGVFILTLLALCVTASSN